jgi:hypothetical protein
VPVSHPGPRCPPHTLLLAVAGAIAFLAPSLPLGDTGVLSTGAAPLAGQQSPAPPLPEYADPGASDLAHVVQRYVQDRGILNRRYSLGSPAQRARMAAFYGEWGDRLDALDYDALNLEGKIDWVLLRNRIRYEEGRLEVEAELEREAAAVLPFQESLVRLHEARRDLEPVDPRAAAETLAATTTALRASRDTIRTALQGDRVVNGVEITPVVALRLASKLGELNQSTTQWFTHFDGYDPGFSWWVRAPHEALGEAVEELVTLLRQEGRASGPASPSPRWATPWGGRRSSWTSGTR